MKTYDTGSFRDPTGRVFYSNNKIYREIFSSGFEKYNFIKKNDILSDLVEKKYLVNSFESKEDEHLKSKKDSIIIRHEKIDYISYPYEWSFSQLQDAAIFHLDLQLYLLEKNAKLIDASAYNIQFHNNKPIFIDLLSIEKYQEGEFWSAHKQFCENFLNPLILASKKSINFNNLFRGNLNGVSTGELCSMLNFFDFLSPVIFINVYMLNIIENRSKRDPLKTVNSIKNKKGLSKSSFKFLLLRLKKFISKLKIKNQVTVWENYSDTNTYSDNEEIKKIEVVENFLQLNDFKMLADLGCNDGKYSRLASKNKIEKIIAFDFDLKVIDRAYLYCKKNNLNILPLYLDFSNPSSNLGWLENERKGFIKRANFDSILALALIHHLAIAKNIPLSDAIDFLTSLAPKGLIEFVPKEDPTVKLMMSLKGDIFPNYTEENFKKLLEKKVKIEKIITVSKTNRKIYEYTRL